MYEKVNPSHPDKLADRIAGAIVDLAYKKIKKPRIAVEVLLGHGTCNIICESSVSIKRDDILEIVNRIAPGLHLEFELYHQLLYHLNQNNPYHPLFLLYQGHMKYTRMLLLTLFFY